MEDNAPNSFVSTREEEEELERKALSYKRTTILFIVLSAVLLVLILWEAIELFTGGLA